MTYKHSKENLLKEGFIKKCTIDYNAIKNLLKRAYVDLKTAKRNLTLDEEKDFLKILGSNFILKDLTLLVIYNKPFDLIAKSQGGVLTGCPN